MRHQIAPAVGRVVATAALLLVSMTLSSCAGDDSDEAEPGPGEVGVTLADFTIHLDKTSAPAGKVTFNVVNDGPSTHEFVVFKTDKAQDALPVDDSGDVAEGDDFAPVDEIEDIAKGATPELEVDLDAGAYVLICNVPAHYRQGMHAAFTVR